MHKLMYLAPEHWSSRYEPAFFTVRIEARKTMMSSPISSDLQIGGKTHHPAIYYEVKVLCQHDRRTLHRRYSNFRWLYQQLISNPPVDEQPDGSNPISMPPGTCLCQPQDDEFSQNRMEELYEFMKDILQRPGYANHPSVVTFLELDMFNNDA